MVADTREREQKYESDAGILVLPSLADLPGVATESDPESETLVAEYFDTDDLRLIKAGVTLRRREGGHDEGWHLKLPEDAGALGGGPGASSRREIRLSLEHGDRDRDPVPGELSSLVRAYTRGAALRPVARIETRRRRTLLRDSAGESLAEVAADEVVAHTLGDSTTLSRWNEVEVELTGGDPRLLRAASKRLHRNGLRPASYPAKLERALSPVLAGRQASDAGQLKSSSTAGDVVLAYVDAQGARLKALDPQVRRDEPDAIHQMRVTARRLRAALKAFPMVLTGAAVEHLADELQWLGRVLGDARDAEVLAAYFQDQLASVPEEQVLGPAKARLTVHFAPRRAQAREAVTQALDSPRYLAILDELDRLLSDPPLAPAATASAAKVLPHAIDRTYRRAKRRMRRAQNVPAGPARETAFHQARKAAKRARYTAEASRPALGKKARRFAKRMKAVQSVLGDSHDAVTARAAARQIGVQAHLAGENAFSFGLLHERADRDAAEHERRAKPAWKRAVRHAKRLR